jgi:hypothetical protein
LLGGRRQLPSEDGCSLLLSERSAIFLRARSRFLSRGRVWRAGLIGIDLTGVSRLTGHNLGAEMRKRRGNESHGDPERCESPPAGLRLVSRSFVFLQEIARHRIPMRRRNPGLLAAFPDPLPTSVDQGATTLVPLASSSRRIAVPLFRGDRIVGWRMQSAS